jgi:AraC-like DNA-binding protein
MSDHLTILATSYQPECRIHIDKHIVGYYTIQFMSEGGVDLSYDDRHYSLKGAWFWTALPGPRVRFHASRETGQWFHRHVGFTGPRAGRWMALGLLPRDPWPAPPGRDWSAAFDEVIAQTRWRDPRGQMRAVNLLEQLLLDLADARAVQPVHAEEEWLESVRDALSADGVFGPDYAQIAAGAGMSLTTLRRRFRNAMGMSMQDYVLQARLAAARELLAETNLPLKTVAEQLGYDSVYFFCRQFRQQVGVPPGLYRKTRAA